MDPPVKITMGVCCVGQWQNNNRSSSAVFTRARHFETAELIESLYPVNRNRLFVSQFLCAGSDSPNMCVCLWGKERMQQRRQIPLAHSQGKQINFLSIQLSIINCKHSLWLLHNVIAPPPLLFSTEFGKAKNRHRLVRDHLEMTFG